jgi:hypothetical protein
MEVAMIKMLEITTMIMWASLRGFEEVEAANQKDTVILRGGGSGYGYVEFSEEYEIVLSPDASFSVSYTGDDGHFELLGEGREQLEEQLEQIEELREPEEEEVA